MMMGAGHPGGPHTYASYDPGMYGGPLGSTGSAGEAAVVWGASWLRDAWST